MERRQGGKMVKEKLSYADQVKHLLPIPLPWREGQGEGEKGRVNFIHPHLASPIKGEEQCHDGDISVKLICMG